MSSAGAAAAAAQQFHGASAVDRWGSMAHPPRHVGRAGVRRWGVGRGAWSGAGGCRALGPVGVLAAVQAGSPLPGSLLARAPWRLQPTQSPPYPKTDGKAMAKLLRALGARRARDRGGTGEGSRNGIMERPANPQRSSRLSQLAPKLQALIAAHWWWDLRVFALWLHGTAAEPERCDLLVDFPGSPSFEQYMDLQAGPGKILPSRSWNLVTLRGLRPEFYANALSRRSLPLA